MAIETEKKKRKEKKKKKEEKEKQKILNSVNLEINVSHKTLIKKMVSHKTKCIPLKSDRARISNSNETIIENMIKTCWQRKIMRGRLKTV